MDEKIENLQKAIDKLTEMSGETFFLMVSLIIIWFILQAIFGSYLKNKFKILANSENFEELKEQLTKNTQAVEAVKANVQAAVWISQQNWTKKHESYEIIISTIFKMKRLLSDRLNENSKWLLDICKDEEPYDLDCKYESLINFSKTEESQSFVSKLESLEEKILAKSVFLTSEFKGIETEIVNIRHTFVTIKDTVGHGEAHENIIRGLSKVIESKIEVLEKSIVKIKAIASKDLTIDTLECQVSGGQVK